MDITAADPEGLLSEREVTRIQEEIPTFLVVVTALTAVELQSSGKFRSIPKDTDPEKANEEVARTTMQALGSIAKELKWSEANFDLTTEEVMRYFAYLEQVGEKDLQKYGPRFHATQLFQFLIVGDKHEKHLVEAMKNGGHPLVNKANVVFSIASQMGARVEEGLKALAKQFSID